MTSLRQKRKWTVRSAKSNGPGIPQQERERCRPPIHGGFGSQTQQAVDPVCLRTPTVLSLVDAPFRGLSVLHILNCDCLFSDSRSPPNSTASLSTSSTAPWHDSRTHTPALRYPLTRSLLSHPASCAVRTPLTLHGPDLQPHLFLLLLFALFRFLLNQGTRPSSSKPGVLTTRPA
ncbi:hypothetical protein B0H11DRAFT_2247518 [Mycena galericulata]|nr:hypothetical protein B0H11DRAFT_2247518 [Mycena galericulata]